MIHRVKNQEEIKKILENHNGIIVLNFHSETCGPCIMQMPVLEDLSNDLRFTLLTFDIDEDSDNSLNAYKVTATPTTLVFKDNDLKFSHTGFLSYEEWESNLLKFQ